MIRNRSFWHGAVAAAALAALCSSGFAQTTTAPAAQPGMQTMPSQTPMRSNDGTSAMAPAKTKVSKSDRSFMIKAAQGGTLEVELGKMAQQKATNDQVKQFGQRMDQDHSKANDELRQIATNKGVELPKMLSDKQNKDVQKLKNAKGADFDRTYMKQMVADHKKDIAAFEKEAKNGKDADLKAFAEKTLPTLRDHLQMAEQTQDLLKHNKGMK